MAGNFIPHRGDVVWIDMQPQAGHEQSGRRPAIIKGYPFEVMIPSGLKITGVVLSDQVKSLDWKIRGAEFCDKVPEDVVLEIFKKLKTLLNFDG